MMKISGLYAITPEIADTSVLLTKAEAALAGGANLLQYRSKFTDVTLKHEQATELLNLCKSFRVPLIINDDVRLAVLSGADGVHLGADDTSLKEARINLGAESIIGVSCYGDLERAARAQAEGADYLAFGSFYSSGTKPQAPLVPISTLQIARARFSVPLVAIGGIQPDNAQALLDAGADAVAVISALFDAMDIQFTAQYFASIFATKH